MSDVDSHGPLRKWRTAVLSAYVSIAWAVTRAPTQRPGRLRDAAANEGARVKAAAEERTKQLKEQVSKAVREKDALRAEVGKLRHQNQELREKVVRQDAAWKRKIERERKNGRGGYVLESGSAGAAQRVKLGSRDKENKAAAASNQQSSSSSSSSHLKTEKPRPNANAQTSKKGSDSNNNCVADACVSSFRASKHFDTLNFFCTCIIRYK